MAVRHAEHRDDRFARGVVGLMSLVVLLLGAAWAALAIDYATGPGGSTEDGRYIVTEAVLGVAGVGAAAAAGVAGISYSRTGERAQRRRFVTSLLLIALFLPCWLFPIAVLSSD